MNQNQNINPDNEIDLLEIFRAIKEKILVVLVIALAFGAVACAYTKLLVNSTYSSSARMMVLTKETTLSSLADLQMGTQLTNDYEQLITSPPVLQEVIDDLDLEMQYKTLQKMISINNPDSTRILEITVTCEDPEEASIIVNQLAEVASDYISEVMEVTPPKIFSTGEIPSSRTSPSMRKNAMLGLLLGAILAILVISIMTILNDTIKSEEDVERYLGVSTLASVPNRSLLSADSKKAPDSDNKSDEEDK